MNNKLPLYDWLIKHRFGIQQMDEYKKAKAEHVGSLFYIIYYPIISIEIIAGILGGLIWPMVTLYGLIGFNFIFYFIFMIYTSHYVHKYKLDEKDVEYQDYKKNVIKIVQQSILIGIYFFFVEFLFNSVFDSVFDKKSLIFEFKNFFHPYNLTVFSITTLAVVIVIIIIRLSRTKRFK